MYELYRNSCFLYRISFIRCRYILLSVLCGCYSRVAFNFLGKLENINDDWIRHIRAIQWRLLDIVSNTHSLSVLQSAGETSHTTLALAHRSFSKMVIAYVGWCVAYTSHGYYSKAAFILLRASDCEGQHLFSIYYDWPTNRQTDRQTDRHKWLLNPTSHVYHLPHRLI